jgi:hypothetical protein
MRKESLKIARAFAAGVAASAARTRTDGHAVYLHGNLIAKREPDGSIWVTLAGWGTVTTRDRVNTLCRVLGSGVHFFQRDHVQHVAFPDGAVFETCPRDRWEIAAPGGRVLRSAAKRWRPDRCAPHMFTTVSKSPAAGRGFRRGGRAIRAARCRA